MQRELIEATLREERLERSILPVPLKELGKNLILEAAHTKLKADGTSAGTPERSKILPQVDLSPMYKDALDDERNDEKLGYLLAEYGTVLQEESIPLLREMHPEVGDTLPLSHYFTFLDGLMGGRYHWATAVIAELTSCTTDYGNAYTAHRLQRFVDETGTNGVFHDICSADLTGALVPCQSTIARVPSRPGTGTPHALFGRQSGAHRCGIKR